MRLVNLTKARISSFSCMFSVKQTSYLDINILTSVLVGDSQDVAMTLTTNCLLLIPYYSFVAAAGATLLCMNLMI